MASTAEERIPSRQATISPLSLLTAADRISDALISVDANWNIVYLNESAARTFRVEPSMMVGKDIRSSTRDGAALVFLPEYELAMVRQEPTTADAYYPSIDAWFEHRIFPARTGLSILFTDITERKRSEQTTSVTVDRVNYLMTHDRLTGLCNRVYYEEEKDRLEASGRTPVSVIIADINGLKRINNALGTAVGNDMLRITARMFESACRSTDIVSRTGGDEFSILLPGAGELAAEKVIARIRDAAAMYNAGVENEMMRVSLSFGTATKSHNGLSLDAVERMADDYMSSAKLLEKRSLHSTVVSSITSTMVAKSPETEEHAERLRSLCRKIGESLRLSDVELNELELFAVLHDIGKIAISDKILNKPGELTPEEWRQMKKHSEIGCEIAKASPELMPIARYILTHHENWNGTGYPHGISGEQIPLASRILAVADAYDAMTQDRVYRSAMGKAAAIGEILLGRGTRFDPNIVDVFLRLIM